MPDLLPPQSLLVFEAVVSHGSFSAAARRLGSSQPAVSHHIRQLERALGRPLFRRVARGVTPTPAGRRLAEAVTLAFDELRAAARAIRRSGDGNRLSVATDFAFAAFWLLPRLPALRASHPAFEVRLITAQEPLAPESGGVEIALRARRDCLSTDRLLFPEEVLAVSSPGFLEAAGPVLSPEALLGLPLIHLESGGGAPWFDWGSWLKAAGVAAPPPEGGLAFNSYPLAIQAATAGQGVVLGWRQLVAPLIDSGGLRPVLDLTLTSDRVYCCRASEEAPEGPADRFIQWLLTEVAKTTSDA